MKINKIELRVTVGQLKLQIVLYISGLILIDAPCILFLEEYRGMEIIMQGQVMSEYGQQFY